MKCPNCNETLLVAETHGVEIDYCLNFRGEWT
ncbi:zf-TFIIB domain-containing protein [Sphingobacterium daejeonense]|uniref:Zf-TFIIB domain-containing protein n=1 Tax=Sphingobacterium daejeonense TaxID=371142 RepID=A0ABW3RNA1_9SPHI